ncbi:unnamed protein product, partial [Coccothraustes coccothraustes]
RAEEQPGSAECPDPPGAAAGEGSTHPVVPEGRNVFSGSDFSRCHPVPSAIWHLGT